MVAALAEDTVPPVLDSLLLPGLPRKPPCRGSLGCLKPKPIRVAPGDAGGGQKI